MLEPGKIVVTTTPSLEGRRIRDLVGVDLEHPIRMRAVARPTP